MHVNNFFGCGPKFMVFLSSNVGGVVVDQLLFRFSICGSVSEIFAIKVESCQKSRKILDSFFGPSKFQGVCLPKIVPRLLPLARGTSYGKRLRIFPLDPKLLTRKRWILGQIFNVHDYNFWGRPQSQFGCALGSLGQCLALVKISGRSTP